MGNGSYSDSEMNRHREEYMRREAEKRESKKRRRKKERIRKRLFSIFLTVLLILCAIIIILKTPLFYIEKLVIEGNEVVSDEDIIRASGLNLGKSILDRSSSYSERGILSLPYISEVSVEKKLPSTVKITVRELGASFALVLDGQTVLIDKNGKSIDKAEGDAEEGLPVINCGVSGDFALGNYVKLADEAATENLMRCLKCVDYYGFSDITYIDISDEYNIVFVNNGELKIKVGTFGSEDELSYKMAYIKEVMEKLPDSIKGVIDATNPHSGVSFRSGDSSSDEEKEETEQAKEEEISTEDENEEEKTDTENENL